jgi:hypothetical protein
MKLNDMEDRIILKETTAARFLMKIFYAKHIYDKRL